MKTSERGIDLIKGFEGCRLDAYVCPAGVLTIGYGHTKGVKKGDKITQAQAEELLKEDLVVYEQGVSSLVKVFLHQCQFDVLVSFVYNLGVGALKTSTLLKKINGRASMDDIRKEWVKWCHAGGKVVAGLQKRRNKEVDIFTNGYK